MRRILLLSVLLFFSYVPIAVHAQSWDYYDYPERYNYPSGSPQDRAYQRKAQADYWYDQGREAKEDGKYWYEQHQKNVDAAERYFEKKGW